MLKINIQILIIISILLSSCKTVTIVRCDTESINIMDFGAIPNDNKDDSDAIQRAINYAINNDKLGRIYIPAGIFDLDKGVTIVNVNGSGHFKFITMTISGHQPAYSSNQTLGNVSVLRLKNPTFGIALQLGRNCVIENLVFEGASRYLNHTDEMPSWSDLDWVSKVNLNANRYSPSCAIAIDPFHNNVPLGDRYPGYDSFYKFNENGGTSMLLIKGCAFSNHYIAIANNSSAGAANGDNIRAEQCYSNGCHTFWSCGQSQSRGNSIENVYALHHHTFVSGGQIGNQNGTPPTISNVNVAGFTKYVFDISTGYGSLNVYKSYFESIWSLGMANGIHTSFDQCQFSFRLPDKNLGMPLFHLYADRVVSLRDCDIQYSLGCDYPLPFLFRCLELLISGGSVTGGVITANGVTNAGGDALNKVQFDGVFIKCQNHKVAGKKPTMRPAVGLNDELMMGGEIVYTSEGDMFVNSGTTYDVSSLGTTDLKYDLTNKVITCSLKDVQNLKQGDNIFTHNTISLGDINSVYLKSRDIKPYLGYIDKISGNTITIKGVPEELKLKQAGLYKVAYPVFDLSKEKPTTGNRNANSSLIHYKRVK